MIGAGFGAGAAMGTSDKRTTSAALAIIATLLLASALTFAPPASATPAQLPGPNCGSSPEIKDTGPSNWQNQGPDTYGVLCNYTRVNSDGGAVGGIAITIEYTCPAAADAAWQSKAAGRTTYIEKTATKVVIREDGGFQVFSGFYELMEKAFLRLESGTIATVVAYGNSAPVFDGTVEALASTVMSSNHGSVKLPCAPSSSVTPSSATPSSVTPASTAVGPTSSSIIDTTTTLRQRPLCPEASSLVQGFSKDDLQRAGITDLNATNLYSDQQSLIDDFRQAQAAYNAAHPGQEVSSSMSKPYGGTMGALTWLFASGGTYGVISKHFVVGREKELRQAIMDASENRDFDNTNPKLSPGDVFKLALELTDGNANQAMLLAHNTMRSMARSGNSTAQLGPKASALAAKLGKTYTTDDAVGTGVDFEPAFFDKYLQPMRKGSENGGPWYHLFGMGYYSMVSEGDKGAWISPLIIGGLMATGVGNIPIGVLAVLASGQALTDDPQVANQLEQYYRQEWDDKNADPEKFCMNVYGALLGYLLYNGTLATANSKGMVDSVKDGVAIPIKAGGAWVVNKGAKVINATVKGGKFVLGKINAMWSPFDVQWTSGIQTLDLKQGADRADATLKGFAPVLFMPVLEEESWGGMWANGDEIPQTVTFTAAKAGGVLHFKRFDLDTAQLATYEVTAANVGDTFKVQIDEDKLDPDLLGGDGKVYRPTITTVSVNGASPVPAVTLGEVTNDSDAAVTAAVGAVVVLGGLLLLILIIAAMSRRGRRARPPAYAGMAGQPAPMPTPYPQPVYPQAMPPPAHAPPPPRPSGPPPSYSPTPTPMPSGPPPGPSGPPPGPSGPPQGPSGPPPGPSGPPPGPAVAAPSPAPGRWGYVDEPLALFDSRRTHVGALRPGTWYEVLDEQAGWANVRTPDRITGWVDAGKLKRNP
jgi:hypothetical protein